MFLIELIKCWYFAAEFFCFEINTKHFYTCENGKPCVTITVHNFSNLGNKFSPFYCKPAKAMYNEVWSAASVIWIEKPFVTRKSAAFLCAAFKSQTRHWLIQTFRFGLSQWAGTFTIKSQLIQLKVNFYNSTRSHSSSMAMKLSLIKHSFISFGCSAMLARL